jgi:hypothetical protein
MEAPRDADLRGTHEAKSATALHCRPWISERARKPMERPALLERVTTFSVWPQAKASRFHADRQTWRSDAENWALSLRHPLS